MNHRCAKSEIERMSAKESKSASKRKGGEEVELRGLFLLLSPSNKEKKHTVIIPPAEYTAAPDCSGKIEVEAKSRAPERTSAPLETQMAKKVKI